MVTVLDKEVWPILPELKWARSAFNVMDDIGDYSMIAALEKINK